METKPSAAQFYSCRSLGFRAAAVFASLPCASQHCRYTLKAAFLSLSEYPSVRQPVNPSAPQEAPIRSPTSNVSKRSQRVADNNTIFPHNPRSTWVEFYTCNMQRPLVGGVRGIPDLKALLTLTIGRRSTGCTCPESPVDPHLGLPQE